MKRLRPQLRIFGVEPRGAAAMSESLRIGRAARLERVASVADGLAPPMAGEITYPHVLALVDDVVRVSDAEITAAVRALAETAKMVVEPAGRAGVAALLSGRIPGVGGGPAGVIVSGRQRGLEPAGGDPRPGARGGCCARPLSCSPTSPGTTSSPKAAAHHPPKEKTSPLCRFVCYSGDEMPVRPIVFGGSHTLVRQSYDAREMGHGIHNADGYGVGWYHGGRPVRIREARPIWHDPDLEDVLSSVRSTWSLALVRSASPGIPLDRGEVAPFVFETLVLRA